MRLCKASWPTPAAACPFGSFMASISILRDLTKKKSDDFCLFLWRCIFISSTWPAIILSRLLVDVLTLHKAKLYM